MFLIACRAAVPRLAVSASAQQPKARSRRTVDRIDFFSSVDESLFASSKRSTYQQTPSALTKQRANAPRLILPFDEHYTSRSLLALFTKPSVLMALSYRRALSDPNSSGSASLNQTTFVIDSQLAMGSAISGGAALAAAIDGAGDAAGSSAYDDFDFDLDVGGNDHFLPDAAQSAAAAAADQAGDDVAIEDFSLPADSSKPLVDKPTMQLSYARVAKRVDVRALKQTLWTAIEKTATDASLDESSDAPSASFQSVINDMSVLPFVSIPAHHRFDRSEMVPPNALSQISVPYCFICVLHLANEHGLEFIGVEPGKVLTDFAIKMPNEEEEPQEQLNDSTERRKRKADQVESDRRVKAVRT